MKDDERSLWQRLSTKDPQALEDLVIYHMGLVHFWVGEIRKIAPQAPRNELMQEGIMALVQALQKFNINLGYEFSTYARHWIRNGLLHYLQSSRELNDYLFGHIRRVRQAQDTLLRKLERRPTLEEIAKESGLKKRQVLVVIDAMAIVNAEELSDLESGIPISSGKVKDVYHIILIRELLLHLNKRERWIIGKYYDEGDTDNEIAVQLGITPANVKMIRTRALKKLGKLVQAKSEGEPHEN